MTAMPEEREHELRAELLLERFGPPPARPVPVVVQRRDREVLAADRWLVEAIRRHREDAA